MLMFLIYSSYALSLGKSDISGGRYGAMDVFMLNLLLNFGITLVELQFFSRWLGLLDLLLFFGTFGWNEIIEFFVTPVWEPLKYGS